MDDSVSPELSKYSDAQFPDTAKLIKIKPNLKVKSKSCQDILTKKKFDHVQSRVKKFIHDSKPGKKTLRKHKSCPLTDLLPETDQNFLWDKDSSDEIMLENKSQMTIIESLQYEIFLLNQQLDEESNKNADLHITLNNLRWSKSTPTMNTSSQTDPYFFSPNIQNGFSSNISSYSPPEHDSNDGLRKRQWSLKRQSRFSIDECDTSQESDIVFELSSPDTPISKRKKRKPFKKFFKMMLCQCCGKHSKF